MLTEITLFTLTLVAVLVVAGLPLAFLVPARFRRHGALLTPLLGFGVLSSTSHYLGAAGFSVRAFAWPTIILVALLATATCIARGRRAWSLFVRPSETLRPLLLIATIYAVALIPLLIAGAITPIGVNSDIVSYVCRAELVTEQAVAPTTPLADQPCDAWAAQALIGGLRRGAIYLIAIVDILTGARAYQIYPIVITLFFALTAGSLYVFCRQTLRFSRNVSLFVSLLAGSHNLLLWPVYDGFISQVIGACLLPITLSLMVEALRRPCWRTTSVAGFLLATLCSAYPPHALLAVGITLAVTATLVADRWCRSADVTGQLASAPVTLGGIGVAAILSNAIAWSRVGQELTMVMSFAKRKSGNIQVFPHPGEIFGLVHHPTAAYDLWFPQLPVVANHLLFALAIGLCINGWLQLRPTMRPVVNGWLLVALLHTLIQRVGWPGSSGFPYGYYKSLTPTTLILLPLFALGLLSLGLNSTQRVAGEGRFASTRRIVAPLLLLLLLAIHTANTGLTLAYAGRYRVVADRDLLEIGEGLATLPAETPILVDLPPGLTQNWVAYLLRDHPIRFRRPLEYFRATDGPQPSVRFEQHVLIRQDRTGRMQQWKDPWYDPSRYETIWTNRRYALRRSMKHPPVTD